MFIYFSFLFFHSCCIIDGFVYPSFTGRSLHSFNSQLPWRTSKEKQHIVRQRIDYDAIFPLYLYNNNGLTGLEVFDSSDSSSDGNTDDETSRTTDVEGGTKHQDASDDIELDGESDSLLEFSRDPSTEDSAGGGDRLKISHRLWKLLMGLLIYRAKHGDYMVDPSFVFGDDDEPRLKGYRLGGELKSLIENIKLYDTDIDLYKRLMADSERSKHEYPTYDVVEAPRLLWLIGFPTAKYLKVREEWRHEVLGVKGMASRIKRAAMIQELASLHKDVKEDSEADPVRIDQVKKVLVEFVKDEYKYKRDSMVFNKKQQLPDVSNRAQVRPNLLKNIVAELLEIKQAKNSSILSYRPTRQETEGGYQYAFYHWTFEDVIECMVLFNDMYMDYNREMLIESEKNGMRFNPITFNILKPEWRVPSEELWPERFWGLPLGIWLEKFRNGDIDAKQHWLRRDVLDYLQFDWGDGLKYLTFTWDKLSLGLLWYINLRGHPILEIPPNLVVSQAELVAKWGKPEEIQGLKLGYVFYSAMDQIQVLRKYYPQRYDFLNEMGVNYIFQEEVDLGYKPMPHQRFNSLSRYLKVSRDGKYLKD